MSLYSHGFARICAAVPLVALADPARNAERTIELIQQAHHGDAALVAFPELGLCGYSVDDLVQQDALLDAVMDALAEITRATTGLRPLVAVGAPLRIDDGLFNCAVLICDGQILGIVPKSYLPNYREFSEQRHFAAARDTTVDSVVIGGQEIPFGTDLIFEALDLPGFRVHLEVCEDSWVPIPPSTWASLAGATVLVNLSGSPVTVGKESYRRALVTGQSARCVAAQLYVSAGFGESTTDLAWDGDAMIAENGTLLARSESFGLTGQLITADIDLDRLRQERARMISLRDQVGDYAEQVRGFRRIPFTLDDLDEAAVDLVRTVPRFPFVPESAADRDRRCREVMHIQVQGLTQRLRATGLDKVVLGVSGGLDSTLALLVAVATFDRLGLPRTGIHAFTMPGFATSEATLARSHVLMDTLGVTGRELDIRPSCRQMLADLGHPFTDGEPVYDVTFENVQAGERTSHLFRFANLLGGIVLGTGDLSELALGWCTYGVGDQMSHYNVNGSVPKTLIRHQIRWAGEAGGYPAQTVRTLEEILDDVISPELVPAGADGAVQNTEETVGPYELHDFFLYYLTRFGYRPAKIAYLAQQAWGQKYDEATIRHWLEVFLRRFMANQFKRTAMPNGPKIGSGGSLSPRADWRSPSDAPATVWLDALDRPGDPGVTPR
ncbi:glutamine-dependent NAD(+) synthetase [Gordonia hirsuta DSM 44140 = NBRC 16056]|uniref:Glutamine-dependent NAD(+) synthetase n=1 Tax=Gordonia hirsuta DSM 44140 = NBRC 16056 TaxID=1121927 RepID=L7LCZ9_9ACTN|nr:NAD(+) synthase [Gordonia hirsuta]GAC58794.1 glutamine-dependent NAD(+) synthetase [Gordonia hirsuta DSM 44140 = NBRC 16056]